MVKIGVNGFGRLGRLLVRIALQQCSQKSLGSDLPTIAIVNDAELSPECMGYLLKHDTIYGPFTKDVIDMDNCIVIEGQRIEAVHERDVAKIPWHKACPIDYVVDTTGVNITCAMASKHLQEKIKGVLVTGSTDIPVFCMGVNHTCFKPNIKTASIGSPSLNCLTAMLRVLHENFKVEKAMATAIHPLSSKDKILDDISSSSNCREGRSAITNFMPVMSAASGRYVARIMPELEGKVETAAIKIPIPCIGAVDLTVTLGREVSYEIVRAKFKEAADCYMKDIVQYTSSDLVSSDIVGRPYSCVFDGKAGVGLPKCTVKLFAWYDAEYAFAHRLFDMIKYIASREVCNK